MDMVREGTVPYRDVFFSLTCTMTTTDERRRTFITNTHANLLFQAYHRKNGLNIKFSKILLCNRCSALHDHYIFYSLK